MRVSRSIVPLFLAVTLTTGLAACSSAEATAPKASADGASTQTPTPDPTPVAGAAAETGDFVTAAWAKPVTNPGELLTTITGTNFAVGVYQVGTAASTGTGQFVNPETNTPIINVGDELVYVNYIVTNTSDTAIPLGFNFVDVTARYDDWPYLQGMDSLVDDALDTQMQINDFPLAAGQPEATSFVLDPGASFSVGQNFRYQANSPITFTATLTPVDDAGDLLHDLREEVEVSTSIE